MDIVTRQHELQQLQEAICGSNCVSIVGLSNTGKSTMLRAMHSEEAVAHYAQQTGREGVFVYLDCNAMLELSGQGFYELMLRGVQEAIRPSDPALAGELGRHYQKVVEPDSQLIVPLSFNNAMTALIEDGLRDLILLLDEFDEAFDALDGRVFLNLRALRDRYPRSLVYVTATVRRLGSKRSDEQTAEFVELSAAHTYVVRPLLRHEADELAHAFALQSEMVAPLTGELRDFLWANAGGHPGLLMAALSRTAEQEAAGAPLDHATLQEVLARDVTVRSECGRLWGQLGPEERETLLAVVVGTLDNRLSRTLQSLDEWGLLREEGGKIGAFCDLMADFVRRQATVQKELPGGVWVDEDAGDVWVGGARVESLTELEFNLLSLLYQRANKLTDKYQIVERVWGVDYLDEVDDARIEKLISRLRQKIEPDPANPHFIVTVRGRGYKLNNPHSP